MICTPQAPLGTKQILTEVGETMKIIFKYITLIIYGTLVLYLANNFIYKNKWIL